MKRTSVVFAAVAAMTVFSAAEAGPSEALAFAIGQCSSQPDDKSRLLCYDMVAAQLRAGQQVAAQPFVQLPQSSSPAQAPVAQAPSAQAPAASPMQTAALPAAPQSAPAPAPVYAPAVAPTPQQSGGTWYDPTSWFGKDNPELSSDKPADFGAENIRTQTANAAPDQPRPLDEMQSGVVKVEYLANGRFVVTLANGQVWRQLDGDTGQARFKTKGGDVVTISRGLLGSYNLVVAGRAMLFKVHRLK